MVADKFASFTENPGEPAADAFEISPNDTADLPQVVTGLNVATPGTVRVTMKSGSTATVFLAAGTVFPLRVTRVWESGTSATGICGLV